MATTAWKTASTLTSYAGGGSHGWLRYASDTQTGTLTASDVSADDVNEAGSSFAKSVPNSSDVLRLSDFGFTTADIPAGSTISKISARIKRRKAASNTMTDAVVQLAIASAGDGTDRIGSNMASASAWTVSTTPGAGSTETYEFTSGLPTDSQIRASSLGVDFQAVKTSGSGTQIGYVGIVDIQVEYTPPPANANFLPFF